MKEEGSFTIELALLMPCILGVIFLIIYLGFYVHDIAVIERGCHAAVLEVRNSQSYNDNVLNLKAQDVRAQRERAVRECFCEITQQDLVGRWNIETDIYSDGNDCIFAVSGEMSIEGAAGGVYKGILKYNAMDVFSSEVFE